MSPVRAGARPPLRHLGRHHPAAPTYPLSPGVPAMSLVNEQPVNDHNGHELSNLVPFRPVPIRSSLDPATPDTTEQAPESSPPLAGPDTTEQPEQQPVTPPPAAAPAPAPPAPHQPDLPPNPTPPSYWGARGLSVVYWIAILTGAVGQDRKSGV